MKNETKTIGFPISHKENENRRALVPEDIKSIEHTENLFFEKGYGKVLNIDDSEYSKLGCHIVDRDEVLKQDIICDPKIGDADYIEKLYNQTIFGWVHATQNIELTKLLKKNKITAYAWEKMYKDNRHIFWRNNELAGEAAILHAFQLYGKMPYETTVAVIGKGNTAKGAIKILNMLGAKIEQFGRKDEALLRKEIHNFDVIVNCVLWDVLRNDHIIYKEDLLRMKRDSMIVDISCDHDGAIESSHPTTIENPVYTKNGVLHYAVDHTPSLFYKTFTNNNSRIISKYIQMLMMREENKELKDSLIIEDGIIKDPEIINVQESKIIHE